MHVRWKIWKKDVWLLDGGAVTTHSQCQTSNFGQRRKGQSQNEGNQKKTVQEEYNFSLKIRQNSPSYIHM